MEFEPRKEGKCTPGGGGGGGNEWEGTNNKASRPFSPAGSREEADLEAGWIGRQEMDLGPGTVFVRYAGSIADSLGPQYQGRTKIAGLQMAAHLLHPTRQRLTLLEQIYPLGWHERGVPPAYHHGEWAQRVPLCGMLI